MLMFVEVYRLPKRRVLLRSLEEGGLQLDGGIILLNRLDDGARVYAFVEMQRDGRHLEGGMLRFACPLECRVEVRIISISLRLGIVVVSRRDKADGRGVLARLIGVVVLFNRLPLTPSHASPFPVKVCIKAAVYKWTKDHGSLARQTTLATTSATS